MTRSIKVSWCALAGLSLSLALAACAKQAKEPAAATPTQGAEAPQGHVETLDLPAIWTSAATLSDACERALREATRERDVLRASATAPRSVDNTLGAFDAMTRQLDEVVGIASSMASLHPDEAVRNAGDDCVQKVSKWSTETQLDPLLFAAAHGLAAQALSGFDARYLERLLRDFRRAGVDKDEATRRRLAELDEKMVKIDQDFERNIREDVRTLELDSVEQLRGLPADYVTAHAPNAAGKIVITTDYPDFFAFQTYAENEALRKQLFIAFLNRGYPANEKLLLEQLAVRREYARLLGFESWADYATEDKMVGSAKAVSEFIEKLRALVKEPMQRDVNELFARKKQDDPKAQALEDWDRFYYRTKLQNEKYQVDAQQVRAYFSYPKVRDGILALYGELFGVTFEALPDAPTWHPSVTAYRMLQEGRELGRFYFDMHPREGKFKHAAMSTLRTGDARGRTPVGVLMCNFPDPSVGDGKALMEHGDVVTFFHEFGHLIHHQLAAESPWLSDNGIATEWDFVEAPSQLLEEWAWDPKVLARFAAHHETNEPIPAALVAKMRTADELGKAAGVGRQLFYTALSYALHARAPEEIVLPELMSEIYRNYSPFRQPEGGHVYANFGHLMGYSSNYYTYQWSLVIAKDLFTRFAAEGLLNPALAGEYRDKVLSPGGTKDARELVRDFLGRDYALDAYRAWLAGKPAP